MSYIGNVPLSVAFLTDTFSGNGSTVAFTMSVAPANTSSILVAVTGVVQDPSTYSVSGTTLTFSAAPPTGTSNISVRYLGIPASGVTTTAYRTVTDTTATAGQTTFTIPSYTVGYVDVFRNGVRLAAADFTATTGTTIVLASGASAGDTITTVSFYVSSVLNAIQQYNGSSVNQTLTTPIANTLTSGSGSSLQLQTNGGTTAVTLDTSQNMGLGVTPSAWYTSVKAFQIGSTGSLWNYLSGSRFANNYYANASGADTYLTTNYATMYEQLTGKHVWYNAPSGTAGSPISFTQAMTLDASGNLVIGDTSTGYRFDAVVSTTGDLNIASFRTTGASGQGLRLGVNTTNSVTTIKNNASSGYGMAFYSGSGGSESMRLDSNGNLLVGTTNNAGNAGTGLKFWPNGLAASVIANSGTAADTWNIYNTTAGAYRFYVTNGGTIFATSTTISAISDIRFKENVRDLDAGLAEVMALQPRLYDWKEGKGANVKNARGFIAQEFEQVFPDLIDEWKDESPEGEEPYKSVRADLIPVLVKAIQEQQAIIEQLKADVAALKGQA